MWTPERITQLEQLIAQNLSASKIAKEMGLPSRSTVCGKARRLGLHINGQSSHSQGQRESKRRYPKTRNSNGRRYPEYKSPKFDEPTPNGNVAFIDAKPHQCRWFRPNQTGAFGLICALETVHDKSYCKTHYLRSIQAEFRPEAEARISGFQCVQVAA